MNQTPASWMTQQILGGAWAQEQAPKRRPSPCLGRWRTGCTTDEVWAWLSAPARGRGWWTRESIIVGVGASSGKAVDWALLYLRAWRRVEHREDPRNSRYHLYRAAEGVRDGQS